MKYISQQLPQKLHVNEIFSYYEKHFEEDFTFPGESHNFSELVCVHLGRVGITADDRAYELTEGMAVLHKPNEFHTIRSLGGTTPRVTILSFSSFPVLPSGIFNISHEQFAILEVISTKLFKNISYSIEDDSVFIHTNLDNSELQIVKNLLEALLLLFDTADRIKPQRTDKDKTFSNIVRFMQDNITKKITTEDICRYTGLGRTYLKALFKQYTGMGIMHYFLLLKLKKSTEMLLSGVPIGEISEILSFSSQSYFSYAFKKEYDMTPIKYRDTFREK